MKKQDIKNYEGLYAIAENGQVWSYPQPQTGSVKGIIKGGFLKSCENGNGYLRVKLRKKGDKGKWCYIHRLVAETFIENQENKPQVNHKDGNRHNNNIQNLEWVTSQENILHSFNSLGRVGGMKDKFGKDHNLSKSICQYSLAGEFIAQYGSGYEAMRITGVLQQNISKTINGKRKSAGGFLWKATVSEAA